MNNFWQSLPHQFSVLAPMEDVTDTVFRQVIMSAGRPDVMFTEFTNCDGLCSVGQAKLIHRLNFDSSERPIIAQIWGAKPVNYEQTARLCLELGFDGVDVNMGCPEKNVTKTGSCSALINNELLAKEIISSVKKGTEGKLPISVKTRIGVNEIETQRWVRFLLSQDIQALTIHGRTVKELSLVPNHFEEIKVACEIKNELKKDTIIIANGDIIDCYDGINRCEETGANGYMIGRGVFSNPYCFNPKIKIEDVTKQQRLELMQKHLKLWQATWKETKHYPKLKKYYKIYCQSFPLASELRVTLMETNNIQEALDILEKELG
jgi:tRNA-dihydrouridine synthase